MQRIRREDEVSADVPDHKQLKRLAADLEAARLKRIEEERKAEALKRVVRALG